VPGVRKRVVLLGAVAFVALLMPSLLLPGSLVLDQRLALPTVGVVVMLGEIVRALAPEGRLVVAIGGVAVAVFGAVSVAYEGAFRDARAFARGAVEGSPHSALAHFCLGQSYQRAEEDDRALVEYRAALALGPAEVVHNNVAVIYMRRAQWPDAEAELREEIAVNPRYARAYYNLGIVLRREGRSADACASETTALELQPDDAATRQERDRDCAGP
jgi:Flp pilus assembly protein TadD